MVNESVMSVKPLVRQRFMFFLHFIVFQRFFYSRVYERPPEKDIFYRKFLFGKFFKNNISIFKDILSIIFMKTVGKGLSYRQLVVLETYTVFDILPNHSFRAYRTVFCDSYVELQSLFFYE